MEYSISSVVVKILGYRQKKTLQLYNRIFIVDLIKEKICFEWLIFIGEILYNMNRNKLFHTVNSILYMYTVYNGKTYGYINEFFFRKYRNNSKIDYKFKSKLNYIFLVLKFLGMYIYL